MRNRSRAVRVQSSLPKLAATAVVCWAIGTNTYFDSTNIKHAPHWNAQAPDITLEAQAPQDNGAALIRVISNQDAILYRQIFEAQAVADWARADHAIDRLSDRRLLGDVLADRYMRRDATLAELKDWLEKYSDLPEASRFYLQAVALAGGAGNLPEPAALARWSGADSRSSVFGFRAVADRKASPQSRRFIARLNKDLRRDDAAAAEKLLEAEQHRRIMPPQEIAAAQGLIAANYFYNGKAAAARNIGEAGAKHQNPQALWFAGLAAWKQNDAAAAGRHFALLAAQTDLSVWDRAAAQFWAARALRKAGDLKNAQYWLEQSARQPHSFYGVMAMQLLGGKSGWSWEVPQLESRHISTLEAQKAGGRALALLQIGRQKRAEDELLRLNPQGQRDLQDAMLALASAVRMPSLALRLGGVAQRANGEPYDAALYPLPPWQPLEGFKVDRALIYALIRHESQFDPMAISDRGACGLMQILPTTATLMTYSSEDKLVPSANCPDRLLDPSTNIAFGQRYVRYLATQPLIGNNLLLMLAAYNGGPSKLAKWIPESHSARNGVDLTRANIEKEDPLYFIESIPLRQTHDYVQHVLIHYWGYRARLGEPAPSLKELANGQWPRFTLPDLDRRPAKGTRDAALPAGGGVKVAETGATIAVR
ncbi:MAG: lytic transglycosylase domain-containing protein [Bdellovibrionales bacterium]